MQTCTNNNYTPRRHIRQSTVSNSLKRTSWKLYHHWHSSPVRFCFNKALKYKHTRTHTQNSLSCKHATFQITKVSALIAEVWQMWLIAESFTKFWLRGTVNNAYFPFFLQGKCCALLQKHINILTHRLCSNINESYAYVTRHKAV